MKKSKFKSLNIKDLSKGFILTTGTTIFGLLGQSVSNATFPTMMDFLSMGKIGLLSGVVYLGKNFLTNSNDEFLKQENNG